MSLCYKQNLVFQLWAVYPAIAGDKQPTYEKRRARNCRTKFYYRQKNKNNKAKCSFHTTFYLFCSLFLSILLPNIMKRIRSFFEKIMQRSPLFLI